MGETERKRSSLIDDLDDDLDLKSVVSKTAKKEPFTKEVKKNVAAASEKAGFPSRKAQTSRRTRKKSPYTIPAGFRMRPEVKEIFHELSDSEGLHDHTTFENALEAYLENLGRADLLKRFNKATSAL